MQLLYTKEFYNSSAGMRLKNTDPVAEYCNHIIQSLWETKDDVIAQAALKHTLLSDFVSVFEYDIEHAVLPEPQGLFKTVEKKADFQRRRLLVQDFCLYLGKVFFLYHECLFRNNCFPVLKTTHMMVNYQEIYDTALADYRRIVTKPLVPQELGESKEYKTVDSLGNEMQITKPVSNSNKNHAVAATFILPSLIEHQLVLLLKNTVLDRWLKGLSVKSLEADEAAIYEMFRKIKSDNHGFLIGKKEDMEKRIWSIGRKYNVLLDDKDMEKLFCKEVITLNQVLNSSFTKAVIKSEYMSLFKYLFESDNLNLRNNIAHGNSTVYDYLDISFVSVMFQVLIDFADGVIVKSECKP